MTTYSTGSPDYSLDPAPAVEATLLSMAQALMARVEQAAAVRGVALPDRRVFYMAPIPADCPQVAVLIGGWTPEPPWEGLVACQRHRWTAQLGVVITRKTPAVPAASGDLPKPSELLAATQMASDDAEILLEVVAGLGEVGGDMLLTTPAAEGGLQSTTLQFRTPAFGGL